ncbi:MAG: hypothetical protein OEX77_06870 [Candidatus Bathyarchaeota archaeon]|nr:hypothetical protein [Candidatus Bathyarchaeota archaeon]
MRRKFKYWLLFLLGICIFIPFFVFSIVVHVVMAGFSIFGVLYAGSFLGCFIMYCYLLYRSVYKGTKPKYPIIPPEGRTDIYFPRTNIPRPIHEDVRRYSKFFKIKKKKKYDRRRKVKKKS